MVLRPGPISELVGVVYFTPTADDTAELDWCASDVDVTVAVYTGAAVDALTRVAAARRWLRGRAARRERRHLSGCGRRPRAQPLLRHRPHQHDAHLPWRGAVARVGFQRFGDGWWRAFGDPAVGARQRRHPRRASSCCGAAGARTGRSPGPLPAPGRVGRLWRGRPLRGPREGRPLAPGRPEARRRNASRSTRPKTRRGRSADALRTVATRPPQESSKSMCSSHCLAAELGPSPSRCWRRADAPATFSWTGAALVELARLPRQVPGRLAPRRPGFASVRPGLLVERLAPLVLGASGSTFVARPGRPRAAAAGRTSGKGRTCADFCWCSERRCSRWGWWPRRATPPR